MKSIEEINSMPFYKSYTIKETEQIIQNTVNMINDFLKSKGNSSINLMHYGGGFIGGSYYLETKKGTIRISNHGCDEERESRLLKNVVVILNVDKEVSEIYNYIVSNYNELF